MEKRRVIIDCDPGHDDIMAILLCLAHPEAFDVLGYTTVCGNQLVHKVTDNLCKVLTAIGREGKVAQGYAAPLFTPLNLSPAPTARLDWTVPSSPPPR